MARPAPPVGELLAHERAHGHAILPYPGGPAYLTAEKLREAVAAGEITAAELDEGTTLIARREPCCRMVV